MSQFDSDEKLAFLFKKYLGRTNTDESKLYYEELDINASQKIYLNQLYSQDIPTTLPTFSGSLDDNGNTLEGSKVGLTSSTHTHIKKYDKVELSLLPSGSAGGDYGYIYECKKIDLVAFTIEHVLRNIILPSYNQVYELRVFKGTNASSATEIFANNAGGNWLLDKDAGLLKFYNQTTFTIASGEKIYMSFYRYVGTIGDFSSGGGSSGGSGATGPQGPQGIDGPTGPAGIAGPTGPQGPKGILGPTGPQGPRGLSGAAASKGEQGVTGPRGFTGPRGPTGPRGLSGAAASKGEPGPTGPIGPYGPTGPQGNTGTQISSVSTSAGQVTFSYTNGYSFTTMDLTGPQGNTGSTGAKGQKGENGYRGSQGPIGEKGEPGTPGRGFKINYTISKLNDIYLLEESPNVGDYALVTSKDDAAYGNLLLYTKDKWDIVGNMSGATGLQGSKGEKGSRGDTGFTGNDGIDGAKGERGLQGNDGIQGPKGNVGLIGKTGDTGRKGDKGSKGDKGKNLSIDFVFNSVSEANTIIAKDGILGILLNPTDSRNGELFVCYNGLWRSIGRVGNVNNSGSSGSGGNVGNGEKGDRGDRGNDGERGRDGQSGQDGDKGQKGQKGQIGDIGDIGSKGSKGDIGRGLHLAKIYHSFDELNTDIEDYQQGTFASILSTDDNNGKLYLRVEGRWVFMEKINQMFISNMEKFLEGYVKTLDPSVFMIKGDQGPSGDNGNKGDQGEIGSQGIKGEQGDIGIQGIKGQKGELGLKGEVGNGLEITKIYNSPEEIESDNNPYRYGTFSLVKIGNSGIIYVRNDNQWIKFGDAESISTLIGPAGPKGIVGDRGNQGIKGEKGIMGQEGQVGQKGSKGEQGIIGEKGSKGDIGLTGLLGPKGNVGDKGEIGQKGDIGIGLQGPEGPIGPKGLEGEPGLMGQRGPKGSRGQKGTPGHLGPRGMQGIPGPGGPKGDPLELASLNEQEKTHLISIMFSKMNKVLMYRAGSYNDSSYSSKFDSSEYKLNHILPIIFSKHRSYNESILTLNYDQDTMKSFRLNYKGFYKITYTICWYVSISDDKYKTKKILKSGIMGFVSNNDTIINNSVKLSSGNNILNTLQHTFIIHKDDKNYDRLSLHINQIHDDSSNHIKINSDDCYMEIEWLSE
jgi:hypothetical protein